MPVNVSVSIPDPPSAPPSYTLCAFEVRARTVNGELEPVAIYPGNTDGFEEAANTLIKAIGSAVKDVGVGIRLAAVAWFSEQHLEECRDGRERIVSVYEGDGANGTRDGWSPWKPESRVHGRRVDPSQPVNIEDKAPGDGRSRVPVRSRGKKITNRGKWNN